MNIQLFRDYLVVIFGSGLGRAFSFFNSILVARLLGPEGFGRFSLFYVVMVLSWSLPQAFDNTFVRYAKVTERADEKKRFLRSTLFVKFVYLACSILLSVPLAFVLEKYCFNKEGMFLPLVAAIVGGSFVTFLMTIASIFQEKEKYGTFALLYSFYTISIFIVLVTMHFFKSTLLLKEVIIIYFIISLLTGAISIILLFWKIGKIFKIDYASLKKVFSLGKWVFGCICSSFLFWRCDILFLGRFVDLNQIGIYSVAAQLIMTLSLALGALNGVFMPKASAAVKSKHALLIYLQEIRSVIIIILAGITLLIFFAPYLIEVLYGPKYIDAALVLRILLVGWMFYSIYLPFSFLFYALDIAHLRLIIENIKIIIAVILLIILIHRYQVIGAAIAMAVCLIVECTIGLLFLRQHIQKKIRN